MIPVMQTLFGNPAGNCLMACVASIMEVPLEQFPDLYEAEEAGKEWWEVMREAVREHRWEITWIRDPFSKTYRLAPVGYAVAGGPSPRATPSLEDDAQHPGHAVVCLDGEMVHDPHPDGDGLAGPVDSWYLLIPPKRTTNPAPSHQTEGESHG